jgi:uncharacterized hydrophobic protein (TIGR00341 family)
VALRTIEAYVPVERGDQTEATLLEAGAERIWRETRGDSDRLTLVAVIGAGRTGAALDLLYERVGGANGFRALVHPLDAVIPRPLASEPEDRSVPRTADGVSREEVYASVSNSVALDSTYLALSVLAAVVAAIGLTLNNTAAVIGAMVVAPLLGPNMGLALGLTLGDRKLVRAAARSGFVGFLVVYGLALSIGLFLDADPTSPELHARTQVTLWDLLLALAAGAAGSLAVTTGAPSSLVGVMVAVALLPPAVASGLLLGEGHWLESGMALALSVANATAVLLAGMATFLAKGMRPRHWWEADQARESARRGLIGAASLFVVLAVAIFLARTLA